MMKHKLDEQDKARSALKLVPRSSEERFAWLVFEIQQLKNRVSKLENEKKHNLNEHG